MSRARKVAIGIGGTLLLVVVAALTYLFVLREDAPPELVLGETRATTPLVGSMFIDDTVVSDAPFTVDVADIESPESLRDGQFRRVMSTDEFPNAVFTLAEPIDLDTVPVDGEALTVAAAGDLALRGVTRPVTFDITAQRNGTTIETLSQIPIVFSEFGIDTPSAPGITVEDNGLLEASIIFTRPQ